MSHRVIGLAIEDRSGEWRDYRGDIDFEKLGEVAVAAVLGNSAEVKRLGWPDIDVGSDSPAHSPIDSYRCENEECPSEFEVWQFRPDDYDLDETIVQCPACGVEGELFLRRFRGGVR